MLLRLDMTADIPLYLQVRNQIVLGIGSGQLKIGQNLPTVRQLAEDTGINVMTVTKAYSLLKAEGFVEIDRRHGAKVSLPPAADPGFQERLESQLSLLVAEARARGMDLTAFSAVCAKLYDNMKPTGGV